VSLRRRWGQTRGRASPGGSVGRAPPIVCVCDSLVPYVPSRRRPGVGDGCRSGDGVSVLRAGRGRARGREARVLCGDVDLRVLRASGGRERALGCDGRASAGHVADRNRRRSCSSAKGWRSSAARKPGGNGARLEKRDRVPARCNTGAVRTWARDAADAVIATDVGTPPRFPKCCCCGAISPSISRTHRHVNQNGIRFCFVAWSGFFRWSGPRAAVRRSAHTSCIPIDAAGCS